MRRAAAISLCGRYRYALWREWGSRPAWSYATFVMLNPSTADAELDDPTIRRCIGFAKAWGLDGLYVVNLYALRATDPRELRKAADPVGPANDERLAQAAHAALATRTPLVAAWGAHAEPARVEAVLQGTAGAAWSTLGLTKAGQPRHPLYLRADSRPTPWRP